MLAKLNFKKLFIGVGLGIILLLVFVLNGTKVLDYLFIRWEFMLPVIVGVYYLSIQPYLNFASARRYFVSGVQFGAALAGVVILINLIYEFAMYGQLKLISNFGTTVLSYLGFVIAYAFLAGVGHYLFNKNVDPDKKDVRKMEFFGKALLIGGFVFALASLLAANRDNVAQGDYYFLLVPTVVSAFAVVKMHNVKEKEYLVSTAYGAIAGLMLGLSFVFVIILSLLVQVLFNVEYVSALSSKPDQLAQTLFLAPVLIIAYTFIGAAVGFMMKFLRSIL
jgi:hypothetical protein